MDEDPRIGQAKTLIGERFRLMLERRFMSKNRLAHLAKEAEMSGANRGYIIELSKGVANPTVSTLAGLASLCGVDFEDFLTGIPAADVPRGVKVSDMPTLHRTLYSLLADILKHGNEDQIIGLRSSLEAFRHHAAENNFAKGATRRRPMPKEKKRKNTG